MSLPGPPDRAARFRTSKEAYDWIMWDSGFTPGDFVIGYDDHDEVMKEIDLESFEPEGEIPWHRIWYIRRDGDTVWDRELRVDRLDAVRRAVPEPPRARSPRVRAASSRSSFLCPHCAERVETAPDLGGGAHQTYIEDCPVCCRPNRIEASWSGDGAEMVVQATPED